MGDLKFEKGMIYLLLSDTRLHFGIRTSNLFRISHFASQSRIVSGTKSCYLI